MNLDLKNKYALVTGGSHGIGRSIALSLAKEGCNIAICSINKEEIEEVVKEIKLKGVQTLGIVADVMILADVERTMKTIIDSWGKIDILINNVGGGGTWKESEFMSVMEKNYGVMVQFTNKFIQNKKWGRVITISSIYGKEKGLNAGFTAAKAAQIAYMKSLAGKFEGITFNTICPGHIDVGKTFPYKPEKIGMPEDVADLAVFLCSDKANHINGSAITVDGGESKSF